MDESDVRTAVGFGVVTLREKAKSGEELLEQIYDEYAHSLFRYALSLLGSADDAEDAVQEVFVRVAREHKRLAKVGSIKAYLFTSARNASYSILRSRRRRNEVEEANLRSFDELPSREGPPSAEALAIRECFEHLPIEQREVLVLKVFEQMTFEEIAKTVRAPVNTAASRYRYGIEKLRRELGE